MRVVRCDGSPESVAALSEALAAALAGGPAVLPVEGAVASGAASGGCAGPVAGAGGGRGGLPDPVGGSALVVETSGSTGEAKRVVLSAAALRASARATHRRLGGPGRWLLALPVHHIAGAQVLVRGLLAGQRPCVLDCREGFRVDRFAALATALCDEAGGRRCYTSLVPTQLHRVLAEGPGRGLDALRRFDAVLVGGAATSPALLAEAAGAGVAVVTSYGMSETAGGCVYDGVALEGVRVRLDPVDGRISLAGPMLATGYLGDPTRTAGSFGGDWFHTCDVGRWDGDGRLGVLGRVDDVIISGGAKVHPAAVERVLTALPGVDAACVVGLADPEWGQLVAAAVVCADPVGLVALRRAVRAELGAASVPRLIRTLTELPLHGIGKPDRTEVIRLLAATR